ncbi:hypothetical protein B0H14DRAFT_2554050 [Mycena olivaceomarginata]|nr:hypothetical protein B0H14DRAFT_2554050 [Mycena olivaceomarginata]
MRIHSSGGLIRVCCAPKQKENPAGDDESLGAGTLIGILWARVGLPIELAKPLGKSRKTIARGSISRFRQSLTSEGLRGRNFWNSKEVGELFVKEMASDLDEGIQEKSSCLANWTMSIKIHNIGLSPTATMNEATLLYMAILRHKDSDTIPSLKLPLYIDLSTAQSTFGPAMVGIKSRLPINRPPPYLWHRLSASWPKPSCLTTPSRFTARSTQFPGRQVARMWTAPCTEPQYPPAALDPTTSPAYMSTSGLQITRKDCYPVLNTQSSKPTAVPWTAYPWLCYQ